MLRQLKLIVIASFLACVSTQSFAQTERSDEEMLQGIAQIEASLKKIAAASKKTIETINAEPTDVKSLQKHLGTDTKILRDWVATNIRWIPYIGALKGAEGTFQARQANSLDQTLLLATLFSHAGYDTQVYSTRVANSEREPLYQIALRRFNSKQWQTHLESHFEQHRGLFVSLINQDFNKAISEGSETQGLNQARENHQQQLSLLKNTVPEIKQVIEDATVKQTFIDALANNYWVETKNPDGTWAKHSVFHESPIAEALVSNGRAFALDAVPAELLQTVRLQVEIDARNTADNQLTTHTVFDIEIEPYKQSNQTIALQLQASGASELKNIVINASQSETLPEMWQAELQQHNAWVPTLVLSRDEVIRQKGFTVSGEIFEYKEEMLGGVDDAVKKKLGEALDSLTTGETSEQIESVVSAVRIIWTVATPGKTASVTKRELFRANDKSSVIIEKAQLELAQAMAIESAYFIQSGRIPWAQIELSAAKDFQQRYFEIRHVLAKIKKSDLDDYDIASMLDVIGSRLILPQELLVLASLRNEGLQDGFLPEPSILTSFQQSRMDKASKSITVFDSTDIVSNVCGFGQKNSRELQMSAGVWDTASEATLKGNSESVRNTVALLGSAQSGVLSVIKTPAELGQAGVASAQYQAMLDDLDAGFWLVVPNNAEAATAGTWWRVDESTGNALGQSMGLYDVGGLAMTDTTINIARLYLSMATYTWGMAQCAVNNRGNARKGLACALCATLALAVQNIGILNSLGPSTGLLTDIGGPALARLCSS